MQLAGHLLQQLLEWEGALRNLDQGNSVGLIDDAVLHWHELLRWKDILEGLVKFLVEWQLEVKPDLLVKPDEVFIKLIEQSSKQRQIEATLGHVG